MKLLITGGFGYLGGRLAEYLGTQGGYELLLGTRNRVDDPSWASAANVIQIPWNSSDELDVACSGVDVVLHLAGMNAQDCAVDPVAALQVNGINTVRLLQASIRQGVGRFIYMSTAHVYSSPLQGRITEQSCPLNLHPYATSHRSGEDVVRLAAEKEEIEGVVIRLSNAFGAPTHKHANCWMLLVNDLCRQAVREKRMVLRSSGMQRRDFIAITEACRALVHLLKAPWDCLGNGVFNVGGGWAPTVLEMTELIAQRMQLVMDEEIPISRFTDTANNYDEEFYYDRSKLIDTGFVSGSDGIVVREIDALIDFCRQHVVLP